MLLRALPLLLALLALCAVSVEARPTKGRVLSRRLTVEERSLTNAERMKRGLPPRAPVIGRMLPGRELLFDPTPASKAKRGSPSPSPSPKSCVPRPFACTPTACSSRAPADSPGASTSRRRTARTSDS